MMTGEATLEHVRHQEVMEGLDAIAKAIVSGNKSLVVSDPPVVNVTVDPAPVTLSPSSVVVRDRPPLSYRFTIERDEQGRIEHIVAEPVNG